jgi:hypothetical protein
MHLKNLSSFNPLKNQTIEVAILLLLNPHFHRLQVLKMIAYFALMGDNQSKIISIFKYIMILSELMNEKSWYSTSFIVLFELFSDCKLLTKRGRAEKVFWSFILVEGLFQSEIVQFWKILSIFFCIYFICAFILFDHKILKAICLNAIFLSYIVYLFIENFHYIKYLLRYKFLMIVVTSLVVVCGVLFVTWAKRNSKVRLVIVRKYFHFLSVIIFLPMILFEEN